MSARTATELPPIERLFELLQPDFEAGTLTWKVGRGPAKAGDIAGCVKSGGYLAVKVAGRLHYAHRLILAMYQGAWPEDVEFVDHINGVKTDNRVSNLRLVSAAENLHNVVNPTRGASGFPGLKQRRRKWEVRIRANGRRFHIGYFDSKLDAAIAYIKAKTQYHPSTPASTITALKRQAYEVAGEYREAA